MRLKTSASTLEATVNDLRTDLLSLTETVKNQHVAHESLVKQTNIAWDEKLVGFLDSADKSSRSMMEQSKRELRREMERNKSVISTQLETLMDKQPRESQESEDVPPKWKEDIESIAGICKSANEAAMREIEEIRNSVNLTNQHRDSPHSPRGSSSSNKRIVLLTDSNGKRLDKKKFCQPVPLKDVLWTICYTLDQVDAALDSLKDTEIDMLVICCGTNDIDTIPGVTVAERLVKLTHQAKLQHPNTKIVVSETTPRQFDRDDEIKLCNAAIHTHLGQTPNVAIAVQSRLRDSNWALYEDNKHILRNRINVYAGNIKSAMRELRIKRNTPAVPNTSSATNFPPNNNNRRGTTNTTSIADNHYKNVAPLMSKTIIPPQAHFHAYNRAQHPHQLNPSHLNSTHQQHHTPQQHHTLQHRHTAQQDHMTKQHPTQPSSSLPPTSFPPPQNTTPIQDRLRRISQSNGPPDESKMRETLITKLGDILMCLQSSAVSF